MPSGCYYIDTTSYVIKSAVRELTQRSAGNLRKLNGAMSPQGKDKATPLS